jgi:hypothetical protein
VVQLCFDFYMFEAKPENLIGDRAYDSDGKIPSPHCVAALCQFQALRPRGSIRLDQAEV